MAIQLGEKFDNWQQFVEKLDAYCKATYQTFVKDESKTVESVNKHRKVPFPSELKFAFVRMSCVHIYLTPASNQIDRGMDRVTVTVSNDTLLCI